MSDNSLPRILIVLSFLFLGLIVGILFVRGLEGDRNQYMLGAAVLLIAVILALLVRMYVMKQRGAAVPDGQGAENTKVGFVVDTFHDLVARLKEKEKELETLRGLAEDRAASMEVYSENILQSVPSGVISVDNAGVIKSVNPAAEKILGKEAKEIIGDSFSSVFREPLTDLLNEDKTVLRAEYPYVSDDGRHIWLGVTTSQLKNAAAEKIGFIIVFTDLTDIKALQVQVELKERLSQLGEMSAGIAHELRNSMSVISGYAKLLGKKVEAANRVTVDSIQSEVSSMNMIISELLAFAKPTVLSREKTVLNEIVKESSALAAGGSSSVEVSFHDDGPVSVMADKVLLRQALTNLFVNANEAMPEGGSIRVDMNCAHDRAHIVISDTGPGIPPEVLQKIFLPFYTTRDAGIGLGLALVQKIIVAHGGSIEAGSREGEGAEFRITLPSE